MTDIPIFTKTYDLYKTFYSFSSSFPKKARYSIGQKCEATILSILEDIITASGLSKREKLPILKETSLRIEVLKVLFRLIKDLKVIDSKKYLVMESYLQEIGKMLGGWIKSLEI